MDQQKEVKIIGFNINQQLGILKAVQIRFDKDNKLIAIKGEVGSGKTTLKRGLELGTTGSESLRDDKQLYGNIDEEIQLLDGNTPVFVGCKSNKSGGLDYVVYSKGQDGKKIKDPIIDGVKATPVSYLKSMQTALTWRMNELTSENTTEQRNILLRLYKSDLTELGVIFDKSHPDYGTSILGQIERAENTRTEKDYFRKNVGGFKTQLLEKGIDPDKEGGYPKRIDISELEAKRGKLQYDINNITNVKQQEKEKALMELKGEADRLNVKLREINTGIKDVISTNQAIFDRATDGVSEGKRLKQTILDNLLYLKNGGYISEDNANTLKMMVNEMIVVKEPFPFQKIKLLEFDENGNCITVEYGNNDEVCDLLSKLDSLRLMYSEKEAEQITADTTQKEEDLQKVVNDLILAKDSNKIVDSVDAYLAWSDADKEVQGLRTEYASKLSKVYTGVEGLRIDIDEKLDIFLMYDGSYDPEYFGNVLKEHRKVSSYSATQKPMICLLLQNYLLSKKEKALRYMWIDDVPIDNKTKALLNRMGEELNLTIFVNITGDFDRSSLEAGELLIEGGEVFFN